MMDPTELLTRAARTFLLSPSKSSEVSILALKPPISPLTGFPNVSKFCPKDPPPDEIIEGLGYPNAPRSAVVIRVDLPTETTTGGD